MYNVGCMATQKEELRKIIGKRIAQHREEHRFSQSDLAMFLGCSLNTIYNYESGRVMPDIDVLYKLSNAFNVSIDDLTGINSLGLSLDIKEMSISKQIFKRYVIDGEYFDISDLEPANIEDSNGIKHPAIYNFSRNLIRARKDNLYVVRLTRYNEILKAPAGALVLVEELDSVKNLEIDDVAYVLMSDELYYDKKSSKENAKGYETKFFTRIAPLRITTKVNTIHAEKYLDKYVYTSPFTGGECIIDWKSLSTKISGIVRKVIIDY